jgi:hypothetical protein
VSGRDVSDMRLGDGLHEYDIALDGKMGGAIGPLFSARPMERVGAFASIEGNLIGEDRGMLSRRIALPEAGMEAGYLNAAISSSCCPMVSWCICAVPPRIVAVIASW